MATASSFDVVSDFDQQELVNAVDQARREITNRYDLKDSATTLDLTAETLTINTDSEFSLDAVVTLLQTKVAKRNLSLKIFDFGKVETASGNRVRQVITLQRGLSSELAKDLSKQIRDQFKKVQVSIQGDALRVSAKSRDDLQTVIQYLKQQDVPAPLQFTNYR